MQKSLLLSPIVSKILDEEFSTVKTNQIISPSNQKFRLNFLDPHDADIMTMPIFMIEKIDILSQLRKRSELDEKWHLIGKDILNPFGVKHRAVVKHQLEKSKKTKKFPVSMTFQKEIRRKKQEKQDSLEKEAQHQRAVLSRKKVSWFLRSTKPQKKTFSVPSDLDSRNENIQTETDEIIEVKPFSEEKVHKTPGEILNKELLNTSWEGSPVISLWEMLDVEESEKKKVGPKWASPKWKLNSRRSTPPDATFKSSAASIGATRRKSCECLQCGGISNLEVRTLHINCDVPLTQHRAILKELKELNHNLNLRAITLADQKRDSGSSIRYSGSKGTSIRTPSNRHKPTVSLINSPKFSYHRRMSSDKGQYDVEGLQKPFTTSNLEKNSDEGSHLKSSTTNLEDIPEIKSATRLRTNLDRESQPESIKSSTISKNELDEGPKSPGTAMNLSRFNIEGLYPKVGEWKRNNSSQRPRDSLKNTSKKNAKKVQTFDDSKIKVLIQGMEPSRIEQLSDNLHTVAKSIGLSASDYSSLSPMRGDLKGSTLFEITQMKQEESPKISEKKLLIKPSDLRMSIKPSALLAEKSPKIDAEKCDEESPKSITIVHPTAKVNSTKIFLSPKRVKKSLSPSYQISGSTVDTFIKNSSSSKPIVKPQSSQLGYIKGRQVDSSPEQRILRTYTSSSFALKRRHNFAPPKENSKDLSLKFPKEVSLERFQKHTLDSEKKLERLLKAQTERIILKKNLSETRHETQFPLISNKEASSYESKFSAEISGTRLQISNAEPTTVQAKLTGNQSSSVAAARPNIAQTVAVYKSLARAGNSNVLNNIISISRHKKFENTPR